MSLQHHPKIIEMTKALRGMEEYLSCPICLDRYSFPVMMKCAHTFCRRCAETHIRNTPKAKCPICNISNVTKRSLVPAKNKIDLINTFIEMVKAFEEDFGVDYESVVVPHQATREAPGDTPFVSKAKLASRSTERGFGPTGDKAPHSICRNIAADGFNKKEQKARKEVKRRNVQPAQSIGQPIPSTSSACMPAPKPAPKPAQIAPASVPASVTNASAGTSHSSNESRKFSFKKLGSLRTFESKGHVEASPSSGNEKAEKVIPFLKLGRLAPYNERKMLSAEVAPSFDSILERKRRRSSDFDQPSNMEIKIKPLSKAPRLESDHEVPPIDVSGQDPQPSIEGHEEAVPEEVDNKQPEEEETEADRFDSLIPNTENFVNPALPFRQDKPSCSQLTSNTNTSVDLFNDLEDDDRMIAGRTSPSPTDIHFSQSQDKASNKEETENQATSEDLFPKANNFMDGFESDDDIFLSTPQKAKTRKFQLSSSKASTKTVVEDDSRFRFSAAGTSSKKDEETVEVIEENERRKIVLVCSGLKMQDDRDMYDDFIEKFHLKQKFSIDTQVTHLIVNVDSSNQADRTLKYLQAINQRSWIVNMSWIKECLRLEKLIQPEKYEVLDTNGLDGPHKARISGKEVRLFVGYEICAFGTFSSIPKQDFTGMLQKEGATVVRSIHSMSFNKKGLLVMDKDVNNRDNDADRNFKAYKLPSVSVHWVLDSISGFTVRPIKKFLLHEAQEGEIEKLGYA